MFDNIDLNKMGEFLSKAQESHEKMRDDLKQISLSASAGGGLVKAHANGAGEITGLEIDDSLLEDKEALSILLICAINDVLKMIEDNKKGMEKSMLGGLMNL